MTSIPPNGTNVQTRYYISQQQTMPQPAFTIPSTPLSTPIPLNTSGPPPIAAPASVKKRLKYIIPIAIALALILMIYLAWNISTAPAALSSNPGITQQNFGNGSTSTTAKNSSTNASTGDGNIQAYIVGAVKNPGVYALPTGARVYALLQAAGGPKPKANLVALNLAAPLVDGEEVYVTLIGEIPPTYQGGVPGPGNGTPTSNSTGTLVNINTASADEMRQNRTLSSNASHA